MNLRDNIHVDSKKIAEGLYDMFDDNEKTALKFGLLPEAKLSPLRKCLKDKSEELFPYPEKIFSEQELREMEFMNLRENARKLADEERKEWTTITEHNVCMELYHVAPMLV